MSYKTLCQTSDLVQNSGVCVLTTHQGEERQLALFYLPATEQKVFAVANWDPLGNANVMSRGIVGSIDEDIVVASPLYKQHFSLLTGECLEEDVSLATYPVKIDGNNVVLVN